MIYNNLKLFLNTHKREIAVYLICEILCISILIWILQLWDADLAVPFLYGSDALAMGAWFKSLIDNIWWTQNSFLGMPFGQVHYDWPLTDTFDLIIIKILGMLFHNFAISMNIFYLLTFPLTALTTLFVFRTLRISIVPSIAGSLIFSFIPYHFLRGEGHILFSSYFLIPLVILVIIWIYQGKNILYNPEKKKIELGNYHTIVSLIFCGLMALQNIYYLFFSCFFFLVIGIFRTLSTRERKYLISCSLLIGFMVTVLLINTIPVFIYQYQNGSNPGALVRPPADSEIFGLKITQLLLPIAGHRIQFLSDINLNYATTAPLINENSMSSLGGFATIGFLLLILWVFYRISEVNEKNNLKKIRSTLDCLSTLNFSAILLATTGGLGVLIAYQFSFPYIRCYNRISIFIAFFAIFTVIVVLEYIHRNLCLTWKRQFLFNVLLCMLLIGVVLDQTSSIYVPDYHATKQQFLQDQHFVDKIEGEMPNGSMIFQLPYMPYPENGPINSMPDYSPVIGYLHSNTLRWSYGSMKGRGDDNWENKVSTQDLPKMIQTLAFAGFNGIYVDSFGYSQPDKIIDTLSLILNSKPIVSENKRYYFFSTVDYNKRLRANMTIVESQAGINSVFSGHPYLSWGDGFYSLERSNVENWRWCSANGMIYVNNPSNQSKLVRITTTFMSGYPEDSVLEISSPLFIDKVTINATGTDYSKVFTLPQGHYVLTLSSDAKRVNAPQDLRNMVFMMHNFVFEEL